MIPGRVSIFVRSGTKGNFTVNVSRINVSGTDTAGTVVTDSVTVTVIGGTAPYTYLWARHSGDPNITATAGTAATTAFQADLLGGDNTSGSWACTVTDATAASVHTTLVYATLSATTS